MRSRSLIAATLVGTIVSTLAYAVGPQTSAPLIDTIARGLVATVTTAFNQLSAGLPIAADGYGCATVRNTGQDAVPCLTAAYNAAAAKGRHRIAVPAGLYAINSAMPPMTYPVVFEGDGWDEGFTTGTRFLRSGTGFAPFTFSKTFGSGFRDIAFQDAQPAPSATAGTAWTPTAYGPWATWQGGRAVGEHILLDGVTAWAFLGEASDGSSGGRHLFHDIEGQVFGYAIDFDVVSDTSIVDKAHFWPYWSFNSNVYDYTIANAAPIISARDDNPLFSNIFVYAGKAGITLMTKTGAINSANNGATSKLKITNLDVDSSLYGALYVTANGATGSLANVSAQATRSPNSTVIPGSNAIKIAANGTLFDVVNFRSTYTGQESVRIDGSNNQFSVSNGRYELWGQDSGSTAGYVYATPSNGNIVTLFNSGYGGTILPKSTGVLAEVAAGSGPDSIIIGSGTSQLASGQGDRSLMPSCQVYGSFGFCAAVNGSLGGTWNTIFGLGSRAEASGQLNMLFGYLPTDRGYVKGALFGSAGPFATQGDNQWSDRHVFGQTSGTTGARLTSGGAATSNNTLNLPAVAGGGLAYGFSTFVVLAHDKAHDLACSWTVSALVLNRTAAASSTRIVGTPTIALGPCDSTLTSAGFGAGSLTIAADTTNDGANISVSGVSGYSLDIAAAPKLIEVQ